MGGSGTGTPVVIGASGGYCNQDDIAKLVSPTELAQLTSDAGDEPDAVVVAEAIATADAEINAYLGVRYQLPLPDVPAKVKALSVDLAIYFLYARRSLVTEARRQRYADGMAFLKDLSKGLAHLKGVAAQEEPGATETVTEISTQPRIFDRDTLKGF